jgi:putative transposase
LTKKEQAKACSTFMEPITFYRSNLPHFTPENAAYFVTTRLADSLPACVANKLRQKHLAAMELKKQDPDVNGEMLRYLSKQYIVELDKALDTNTTGPQWLSQPDVCSIVRNEILKLESENAIDVWCFSVMPNHLHVLFTLREGELSKIMQLLKGRTSFAANKVLSRKGAFWQHESYDHVLRQNEFERIIRYILLNPVNAGLVENWQDWPGNYLRPDSIRM